MTTPSVRHARVLPGPDQTEPYEVNGVEVDPADVVQPSHWNDGHDITGLASSDDLSAHAALTTGVHGLASVLSRLAALEGGGGSGVQTAIVTLSSADILGSGATPVECIPAPGAGKVIRIISVGAHLAYGTTPYTTGEPPYIGWGSSLGSMFSVSVLEFLLDSTASIYNQYPGVLAGSVVGDVTNKPVSFTVLTPAAGDSDLTLFIDYRVDTLS